MKISYVIEEIEKDLNHVANWAAILLSGTMNDLDKVLKNKYWKQDLIEDARDLFSIIYDKALPKLDTIKDDFEQAIERLIETKKEDINF